ncbi:MAG: transcription elongation factor GreB [Myxococcota bacterium]
MSGRRNKTHGTVSGSNPASKSDYITPEGFASMESVYETLWRVERPRVTAAVSIAAALGDRSENADYIYGKKRLREIDSKLRFLKKRLDALTVVRASPDRDDKENFGAWVILEDEEGESVQYRIVGPDEFDPAQGAISMNSPVGRQLMGRNLDDEVKVVRPKGTTVYTIIEIGYAKPQRD